MVKVSGNFDVLGTITQNGAVLGGAASILSSSTSTIAASGTVEFPTERQAHLQATNSDLILRASGFRVAFSTSLKVDNDIIIADSGKIRLNGNGGTYITTDAVSNNLYFYVNGAAKLQLRDSITNSDVVLQGTFNSNNNRVGNVAGHLILTSSVGSIVAASGSLHAKGGAGHGYLLDPNGDSRIDTGFDNQFLIYLGGTNYVQQTTTQYSVPTAITSYEYRLNNAQLSVGGSTIKQYSIRNDSGHLILSAAFGSPPNHITVSGNLKVTLAVTSSDNMLVLGSSLFLGGNSNSEVVLRRSSNGLQVLKADGSDYSFVQGSAFRIGGLSVITSDVSNVVKFKNAAESTEVSVAPTIGTITAGNTHLILSSSVGSNVHVSGNLSVLGTISSTSTILGSIFVDSAAQVALGNDGLRIGTADGVLFKNNTTHTATTEVAISRLLGPTSTLQFSGSSGSVCLTTATGHLIMSSSAGSLVRVSSSLGLNKVASSGLPAGNDNLSGSIIWVDDLKTFAIYGPEGWTRITTGSAL
jgi:hypothetical protein